MTWPTSNASGGAYGNDYRTHAAGVGTDAFTWNLTVPTDGTYQVYVQFPAVSVAATTAGYTITHAGATDTKTINQATNTGTWVSLGSYTFTQADPANISPGGGSACSSKWAALDPSRRSRTTMRSRGVAA